MISPTVDGNTLLFATPGDPVAQIRLPQVMAAVFAALDINAVWVTMQVDAAGLGVVVEGLRRIRNFRGITVATGSRTARAKAAARASYSASPYSSRARASSCLASSASIPSRSATSCSNWSSGTRAA